MEIVFYYVGAAVIGILLILGTFFLWSFILFGITELFRLIEPSFKKSTKIVLYSTLVTLGLGGLGVLIFYLIGNIPYDTLSSLAQPIGGFGSIIIFVYFLKKYYAVNIWKGVGVSIVYYVASSIATLALTFIIATPIHLYVAWFYP